MGDISIVTGHILLNDIESFRRAVRTTKLDSSYPRILPEMFSVGASEEYTYYDRTVVGFAATYKNLEGGVSWSEFIMKLEYLLAQTDFNCARIHLETAFLGDYDFFWGAKRNDSYNPYNESGLIECEKWYFGYGRRNIFGNLDDENDPQVAPYDFIYPVQFDERMKAAFNEFFPTLNAAKIGSPVFLNDLEMGKAFGHDNMYLVWTYLEMHQVLERHYEPGKGTYIKRLKEINPLTTPYDTTSYP